MEISSSEIDILSRRINDVVSGYALTGVYSMEDGIVLRLRHESKQELLIAISSFAPWITTKNLTLPRSGEFVTKVRDFMERSKLVKVGRAGNERITEFSFLTRSGSPFSLFTEFFGGGNFILVDKESIIIHAEKERRFRHRSMEEGEKYVLPPRRGIDFSSLTVEVLRDAIKHSNEKDLDLPSIKWFGRQVSTSRKFVEEIFYQSHMKSDIPARLLSSEQLESLSKGAKMLQESLESATRGYLLVPKDPESDQDVDVCSILPHTWNRLTQEGTATILEFRNLGEALDDAQVQSLLLARKRMASGEIRAKAAELGSAISKQDAMLKKNASGAIEIRKIASRLMSSRDEEVDESIIVNLALMLIIERDETVGGTYRFVSEPRSFVSTFSKNALASRLFEEAKKLEERNRNILEVRADLVRKRNLLDEQSKISEDRISKRIEFERRPREWFERYRWFLTSDFRLAVGGKDSTSNSIVINKYTGSRDIVFHADLYGSPFFILKEKPESLDDLLPEIELQLGQATVSFSRAWKDELGSADAFWVRPVQVKKSAPSGEYLPRGSFFIEGKKNFVKHLRVELSIGIMSADRLPGKSSSPAKDGAEKVIQPIVVCGPEKALSTYCEAQVRISPGKEKSTLIARRAKQILVSKVKDNQVRESVKKIPIDEFIKVLPSGTYKLVYEKQNG